MGRLCSSWGLWPVSRQCDLALSSPNAALPSVGAQGWVAGTGSHPGSAASELRQPARVLTSLCGPTAFACWCLAGQPRTTGVLEEDSFHQAGGRGLRGHRALRPGDGLPDVICVAPAAPTSPPPSAALPCGPARVRGGVWGRVPDCSLSPVTSRLSRALLPVPAQGSDLAGRPGWPGRGVRSLTQKSPSGAGSSPSHFTKAETKT